MIPFKLLAESIASYERVCRQYIEDICPEDEESVDFVLEAEMQFVSGRMAFPLPDNLAIIDDVIEHKGRDYYSPPFYLIVPGSTYDQ